MESLTESVRSMRAFRAQTLSLREQKTLRFQILRSAPRLIDRLVSVALGECKATNAEISAARALLNKVLPDISASYTEHSHTHRDLRQMTREELLQVIEGEAAEIESDTLALPNGQSKSEIRSKYNGIAQDARQVVQDFVFRDADEDS